MRRQTLRKRLKSAFVKDRLESLQQVTDEFKKESANFDKAGKDNALLEESEERIRLLTIKQGKINP